MLGGVCICRVTLSGAERGASLGAAVADPSWINVQNATFNTTEYGRMPARRFSLRPYRLAREPLISAYTEPSRFIQSPSTPNIRASAKGNRQRPNSKVSSRAAVLSGHFENAAYQTRNTANQISTVFKTHQPVHHFGFFTSETPGYVLAVVASTA